MATKSGTFVLDVNSNAVIEMLQSAPKEADKTIHSLLMGAGIDLTAALRRVAPVGTTGDLRGSVHYFFSRSDTVTVEPTAKYAGAVEYGSRPHWTSVRPGTSLYAWATQKGISPYALQRSIARKGTKPHPFLEPTYRIMEPKINDDFEKGIDNLMRQLNG